MVSDKGFMFVQVNKQIYLNLVHTLEVMTKNKTKDRKLGGRK